MSETKRNSSGDQRYTSARFHARVRPKRTDDDEQGLPNAYLFTESHEYFFLGKFSNRQNINTMKQKEVDLLSKNALPHFKK